MQRCSADRLTAATDRCCAGAVYARKAVAKLEGSVEARCVHGELLLEAGSTAAALACFGEAHRLAEGKAPRAAAGVALATWHAGADPSVQSAAVEEARRCGFALSEKLHLARLEIACGRLDEAEEARLHLVWHYWRGPAYYGRSSYSAALSIRESTDGV